MNTNQIIDRLTEQNDVASRAAATRIYKAIMDAIQEGLVSNGRVHLGNKIGTLKVKDVSARTYRNPQVAGAVISKAASKAVRFKASKAIKSAVN